MSRLRAILLVPIALLAMSGCAAAGPAPSPHPTSDPKITAFQPSWSSPDAVDASAPALTMVAVSGIDIVDDGAAVSSPTAPVMAQLDRAHKLGLGAEVLLLDYAAGVGFSEPVAASMLRSAAHRHSAAASLAEVVKTGGWDGVMLDLEELSASDAHGLTLFVKELRAAVGPHIHLDAAIQSSTTKAGYARLGYDIPGLLKSLDRVTLMAYDEHGTWNPDNPGPVGELSWQKKVVGALLTLAPPEKVDLGVAGYGYRWGGAHGAGSLGDHQARRLVDEDGSTAHFDAKAGEWTALLKDGSVFWWADARSLALRISLAGSLGLHGVAVWSLASSDPIAKPGG